MDELILKMEESLIASKINELIAKTKEYIETNDDISNITLDISEVEEVDSTGITFIIGLYKTSINMKKNFKVRGVNKDIGELFSLMKLGEIFPIQ